MGPGDKIFRAVVLAGFALSGCGARTPTGRGPPEDASQRRAVGDSSDEELDLAPADWDTGVDAGVSVGDTEFGFPTETPN